MKIPDGYRALEVGEVIAEGDCLYEEGDKLPLYECSSTIGCEIAVSDIRTHKDYNGLGIFIRKTDQTITDEAWQSITRLTAEQKREIYVKLQDDLARGAK